MELTQVLFCEAPDSNQKIDNLVISTSPEHPYLLKAYLSGSNEENQAPLLLYSPRGRRGGVVIFISKLLKLIVAFFATSQMAFATCTDCSVLDFGKKAQTYKVLPLFSGDMLSKADYLRAQGLDLFKMPTPVKEPLTLSFLSKPPEVLERVFGKHFADGTLGLYLTERAHGNFVNKPAIIFLDSANSWTIAHEYMHHLFDRARFMEDARTESQIVDSMTDAKEDFMSYWGTYKQYGDFLSQHHKESTIASFVVFSEVQQHLLLSFEMEEITIERYLRSIYTSGTRHDFDAESFARSARYIRYTANRALAILNVTLDTCETLELTVLESDHSLKSQLSSVCISAAGLKNSLIKIGKETNIELETTRNSY